jgi:hypothetical protein
MINSNIIQTSSVGFGVYNDSTNSAANGAYLNMISMNTMYNNFSGPVGGLLDSYTVLQPSVPGPTTFVLPNGNGSAGQTLHSSSTGTYWA